LKNPHENPDAETATDDTTLYADEAPREPTAEEKAEQARLRLEEKQRRIDEGEEAMREYLAEADAMRAKTERLRALRLAHEAELAAAAAKAKPAPSPAPKKRRASSAKTSAPRASVAKSASKTSAAKSSTAKSRAAGSPAPASR
jgi:hypothetical protein